MHMLDASYVYRIRTVFLISYYLLLEITIRIFCSQIKVVRYSYTFIVIFREFFTCERQQERRNERKNGDPGIILVWKSGPVQVSLLNLQ